MGITYGLYNPIDRERFSLGKGNWKEIKRTLPSVRMLTPDNREGIRSVPFDFIELSTENRSILLNALKRGYDYGKLNGIPCDEFIEKLANEIIEWASYDVPNSYLTYPKQIYFCKDQSFRDQVSATAHGNFGANTGYSTTGSRTKVEEKYNELYNKKQTNTIG